MVDDTREALAEFAHNEQWTGWMVWQFEQGDFRSDGTWVMPAWAVERWTRQMKTPYKELPEEEKESDRTEADKMLAIVGRRIASQAKLIEFFQESLARWREISRQQQVAIGQLKAERDEERAANIRFMEVYFTNQTILPNGELGLDARQILEDNVRLRAEADKLRAIGWAAENSAKVYRREVARLQAERDELKADRDSLLEEGLTEEALEADRVAIARFQDRLAQDLKAAEERGRVTTRREWRGYLRKAIGRERALRATLEQIANRPDAEMEVARTLHYDMRGWAKAALARALGKGEGE